MQYCYLADPASNADRNAPIRTLWE